MSIPSTDPTLPAAVGEYARKHPLQVVAGVTSISIFLCSSIGFFREHLLLAEFGVNAATFAEVNDFLVAGLKDPLVLAVFPMGIIAGAVVTWTLTRRHSLRRKSFLNRMLLLMAVLYPVITGLGYVPWFSVRNEQDRIQEGDAPVLVHLRSGSETLGTGESPLSLITTTERYVFLWDIDSRQTLIAPSASISYIQHLTHDP